MDISVCFDDFQPEAIGETTVPTGRSASARQNWGALRMAEGSAKKARVVVRSRLGSRR